MATIAMKPGGTISFAEAKNALSALTTQANETGLPFTILKNNRPWVEVRPLAVSQRPAESITIEPLRREVSVTDLDSLFAGYNGEFIPEEDGFSAGVGGEVF